MSGGVHAGRFRINESEEDGDDMCRRDDQEGSCVWRIRGRNVRTGSSRASQDRDETRRELRIYALSEK